MTDSFPSTFPKGYRVVYSAGINLTWTVYDADKERVGKYVGKGKALEHGWKHYLNRLSYAGVAALLVPLQDEDVTRQLRQEIAAIRSVRESKETQISALQLEIVESHGREEATFRCAEAALQSWKTEANEAHKKVEELDAEIVALKAQLKRISTIVEAGKKLSDTLIGCLENPVVAKTTTAMSMQSAEPDTKPEAELAPEPVDPAFDFDGPIPAGMPTGYRVGHQGDRKPMAYKVFGPGGLSISCFTEETAHEKAWEHIRGINKDKVKAGAVVPRVAPAPVPKPVVEDRTKLLPDGYTTRYVHTSKYHHQLTRPDGHNEYFPTHPDARQGAWKHYDKKKAEAAPESEPTPVAHNRNNPPPSFFIKANAGAYRFSLVRPDGTEEKFFTEAAALDAAWKHYDSAKALAKTDKTDPAWNHFRGRQPAKPESKPETKEGAAPPSLPDGFKESFVGPRSQHPYRLTEPSGSCHYYKTPDELIKAAWEMSKQTPTKLSPNSIEPPPGYNFSYDSDKKAMWGLSMPGDFSVWYLSRQARFKAAWKHHHAKLGQKMESIRGMDLFPASFGQTVPEGYKKERTSAQYNPHKLTHPAGSVKYLSSEEELIDSAWEHFRLSPTKGSTPATANRKKVPPGYKESYGAHTKNYGLTVPGGTKICFISDDARLAASWTHYDAPLHKMEAIRGMEDFPRSYEYRLPSAEYRHELSTTPAGTRHKLFVPGGGCYHLSGGPQVNRKAWEHYRIAKNKEADSMIIRTDVPPGYTPSYLGLSAPSPYRVTDPNGNYLDFRSRVDMMESSWANYNSAQAVGKKAEPEDKPDTEYRAWAPQGYSVSFEPTRGKYPHWLKTPAGDNIRFQTREALLLWAWADKDKDYAARSRVDFVRELTDTLPPPPKVAPPDPSEAKQHIPAMMPPHFNHTQLEGASLRSHKVMGPNGYTDYFDTYPQALEAAWRVSRAPGPNWADKDPKVGTTSEEKPAKAEAKSDDDDDDDDFDLSLLMM